MIAAKFDKAISENEEEQDETDDGVRFDVGVILEHCVAHTLNLLDKATSQGPSRKLYRSAMSMHTSPH